MITNEDLLKKIENLTQLNADVLVSFNNQTQSIDDFYDLLRRIELKLDQLLEEKDK
jgi:hypothetical protein